MAKVRISCHAIMCDNIAILDLPDGWNDNSDNTVWVEDEGRWIFCPEHTNQKKWFESVCPGCVESYPDCSFSKAFAFSSRRTITNKQLRVIESGKCPFRTNGTFMMGPDIPFHPIDISDQSTTESGKAIAQAVRQYIESYPSE